MDNRASIRTIGLVAGTVTLLIVLFLVAGISTGFLPWRDSYMENPRPTPNVILPDLGDDTDSTKPEATVKPTPTVTPTPTPTPKPDAEPSPTPTPGITLEEELPTYIITVTFSRGGTAIPYGINAVVQNGSMSVVAVPDDGYMVDQMIVDGIKYDGLDSYQFTKVNEDHTVYISFTRNFFATESDRKGND